MAGAYPDVPGRRMGWDSDGTVCVWRRLNVAQLTEATASQRAELNDEDDVNVVAQSSAWHVYFIFPEQREVDGIYVKIGAYTNAIGDVGISADTTNGLDGAWSTLISDYPDSTNPPGYPGYRENIVSTAGSNARGLYVYFQRDLWLRAVHLYGEISPGQTPDRLLFIDESTGLEFQLPKDYGDVPRGSARDFQMRLKNNSTVAGNNVTLNNIQLTAEDLFLGSGAWYTFSVGGSAFAGTVQIASLAPEAASQLIVCRQVIPVDETLGPHAGRAKATVGSLS